MSGSEAKNGAGEASASSWEGRAADLLGQLSDRYSVFRALVLEERRPPGEDVMPSWTAKLQQCEVIGQTIEVFRELKELDSQLVDNLMSSLSERQYDCVSRFYFPDHEIPYRPSGGFLGQLSFNFYDSVSLKHGLLTMQSNAGLMLFWLGAGETYDEMKDHWPLPARQKQVLADSFSK